MNATSAVTRPWRHHLAALAVATVVTVLQVVFPWRPTPPLPVIDAAVYASIGHQLAQDGVFGNGVPSSSPQTPEMFFAPLYPAFLAGMMRVDATFADTMGCVRNHGDCQPRMGIAIPVQTAVAVLSALLAWGAAWALTRSVACGWLTLVLVLATGHYATYARQILTENLVFPLFTGACLAMVCAWRRRHRGLWLLAGLLLGGLALTRPAFAYLGYAGVAVAGMLSVVPAWRRPALWAGAMLLCGYLAAVAPWLLRNGLVLGKPMLTAGYDGFILVQRLQYNAMSWGEWLLSFLYWQPDFGEKLAQLAFPTGWQRLSWDDPESFYSRGDAAFTRAIAAAGGMERVAGYLMREQLLPNLLQHLVVGVALAWRGVWVMKLWGLVCVPASLWALGRAMRRRSWDLLLFSAPGWFMLAFHAMVSVNVVRYNLIMMPALAVGAAMTALSVWEHFGPVRWRRDRPRRS